MRHVENCSPTKIVLMVNLSQPDRFSTQKEPLIYGWLLFGTNIPASELLSAGTEDRRENTGGCGIQWATSEATRLSQTAPPVDARDHYKSLKTSLKCVALCKCGGLCE